MANSDIVPKFTQAQVYGHLDVMSRAPFRDILARLIGAEPSEEALEAFADKSPDRWAQAVAIFGRMSGFHDKLTIEGVPDFNRKQMSDAAILQRIAELEKKLGETTILVQSPQDELLEVDEPTDGSLDNEIAYDDGNDYKEPRDNHISDDGES